jgi:hypothetical protein
MTKRFLFTALSVVCLSAPAWGVDFSQPLRQVDGKEFSDHATLGLVCETALTADYQDENTQPATDRAKEKFRRYQLAVKIHGHPVDPDLSLEDLALVKALVGKAYPANIMGPAWSILDPPKQ